MQGDIDLEGRLNSLPDVAALSDKDILMHEGRVSGRSALQKQLYYVFVALSGEPISSLSNESWYKGLVNVVGDFRLNVCTP